MLMKREKTFRVGGKVMGNFSKNTDTNTSITRPAKTSARSVENGLWDAQDLTGETLMASTRRPEVTSTCGGDSVLCFGRDELI